MNQKKTNFKSEIYFIGSRITTLEIFAKLLQ
jgi:hypothetical protein